MHAWCLKYTSSAHSQRHQDSDAEPVYDTPKNVRQMTYLTYAFYIVSVILAQMGLHGISYQYLWPNWHEWNKVSTIFFVGLMFLTLAAFTISSLRIKQHSRFFYYLLLLFGLVSGLVSFSSLFFYGNLVIRCTGFLTSILPVVILPAGIASWRKGEKFAPFYVFAVMFYLFGASMYGLKDSGILPSNFLTENGILIGSLVEIAVLSLGIALQIRKMNAYLKSPCEVLGCALTQAPSALKKSESGSWRRLNR